jgi:hypothetical protein
VFPRIREIVDPFGLRLRVTVDAHPSGALVKLERPDVAGSSQLLLDAYGAELLSGYIMAVAAGAAGATGGRTGRGPLPVRASAQP